MSNIPEPTRATTACWLFIALAGYTAGIAATAVHEFLGHGVTALFLGGRFEDVFVSALGGQAGATAPGSLNAFVLAGGSLIELAFGTTAWFWLRRRELRVAPSWLLSVWLLLFAVQAIIPPYIYVTIAPGVQANFGHASGDWSLLLADHSLLRTILLLSGAVGLLPLTALLLQDAARLYERCPWRVNAAAGVAGSQAAGNATWRHTLAAWFTLLAPSVLLRLVQLFSVSPWLERSLLLDVAGTVHLLLLGVPAALLLSYMARRRHGPLDAPPSQTPISPDVSRRPAFRAANAAMLFAALVTLVIFGPAEPLRRGLLLVEPHGDRYITAAQAIDLLVDFSVPGSALVSLRSRPLPDAGARFRRDLTAALASQGPSEYGARRMANFITEWNLPGDSVTRVSPATRIGDSWTWQFEIIDVPDPAEIALWPMTWILESRIEEVRLIGARPADRGVTNLRPAPSGSGYLWSRPDDMQGVQRFQVTRD